MKEKTTAGSMAEGRAFLIPLIGEAGGFVDLFLEPLLFLVSAEIQP